jgi:hypothetical protein
MREDIAKVIVERPRNGRSLARSEKGIRRKNEWKDLDAPTKGSMRPGRKNAERKSFTDLLTPLKGLIRKNVGRPWDKVYQEICEHLKPNSTMQKHVLDHVKRDLCYRNCDFDVNGFPWYSYGRWDRPLDIDELYVSNDGIVRKVRNDWRYKAARKAYESSFKPGTYGHRGSGIEEEPKFDKDGVSYFRKDGIWYSSTLIDEVVDSKIVYRAGKPEVEKFVRKVYKEKQLDTKELKRFELSNVVEEPVIAKRSQVKKGGDPFWLKKNP